MNKKKKSLGRGLGALLPAKVEKNSQIEAENNLIARMSNSTLKSIDKRLIETNHNIKGLAKKDYNW